MMPAIPQRPTLTVIRGGHLSVFALDVEAALPVGIRHRYQVYPTGSGARLEAVDTIDSLRAVEQILLGRGYSVTMHDGGLDVSQVEIPRDEGVL